MYMCGMCVCSWYIYYLVCSVVRVCSVLFVCMHARIVCAECKCDILACRVLYSVLCSVCACYLWLWCMCSVIAPTGGQQRQLWWTNSTHAGGHVSGCVAGRRNWGEGHGGPYLEAPGTCWWVREGMRGQGRARPRW